jgi:hypothetical protein
MPPTGVQIDGRSRGVARHAGQGFAVLPATCVCDMGEPIRPVAGLEMRGADSGRAVRREGAHVNSGLSVRAR